MALLRERLTFDVHCIEGTYNPKTDTVSVRIITEGMGNRRDKHYYSPAVLQRAVGERVFEGAKAFADHPSKFDESNLPERSVKDQVGYYYDVAIKTFRDPKTASMVEGIFATFKIQEGQAQDWLRGLIKESIAYNNKFPDKAYSGISINADGDAEPQKINGQDVKAVTHISEVVSADVVTMPARGGGFIKLAESAHGASQRRRAMLKGVATVETALRKIAESDTVEPKQLLDLANQLREAGGAKCANCDHMHEGKCNAKDCECESFKKPSKESSKEASDKNDAPDDDDEDDTKESDSKESDDTKESDDDKKESAKESESLVALKKKYPSFYAAALKEAEKHVGTELSELRKTVGALSAEKALQESQQLAKRKLTEANLPEHMHDSTLIQLIGLEGTEMDQVIAAQVKFAEGFGWKKGKLVEGAGPRNNGSTQVSVRESDIDSRTKELMAGIREASY